MDRNPNNQYKIHVSGMLAKTLVQSNTDLLEYMEWIQEEKNQTNKSTSCLS